MESELRVIVIISRKINDTSLQQRSNHIHNPRSYISRSRSQCAAYHRRSRYSSSNHYPPAQKTGRIDPSKWLPRTHVNLIKLHHSLINSNNTAQSQNISPNQAREIPDLPSTRNSKPHRCSGSSQPDSHLPQPVLDPQT